ncbi:Otogelin [Manis pentadactyla]|nr:Otogelin [Manis pentadactyla]
MNPQNTMGHHSTTDPKNLINTSNFAGLVSEGKFNLTANLDNEPKLVSTANLKSKVMPKTSLFSKMRQTMMIRQTLKMRMILKMKQTLKMKTKPKIRKIPKICLSLMTLIPKIAMLKMMQTQIMEPSGDANPPSEADSNIDDNASDLNSGVIRDCAADSNNGINPNYTSGLPSGTDLDYTSGPSNATRSCNDICTNNGLGPNNIRPGSNINGSGLQNNAHHPQNITLGPNNPGPSSNSSGPNISGLGPSHSPEHNDNSTDLDNNNPGLRKDAHSNYNVRLSDATSHNSAISPNKDANSSYDIKPTSAACHNSATVSNHDSDIDSDPGFTHVVGSSFVVHPNYIARNSYAVTRASITASIVSVTDTSNTTACAGTIKLSYTAGTDYASDSNHDPRFTHVVGSNFVINPNYVINTHNGHKSTSTSNINSFSEPELEIGPSSSIPNIVYGNYPTFALTVLSLLKM